MISRFGFPFGQFIMLFSEISDMGKLNEIDSMFLACVMFGRLVLR